MLGNALPIRVRRRRGVLPIRSSRNWLAPVASAPFKGAGMPITVALGLPATFYFSKRFPPWPSTAEGTVPYPVGCTGTSARYAATSPVYCGDAQQTASNRVLILPHFPLRVRGLSGTQCWLRAQPSCGGFFRTAVWFAGSRRGAIGFPSGYKSPVSCVFVAGGSTSHASE